MVLLTIFSEFHNVVLQLRQAIRALRKMLTTPLFNVSALPSSITSFLPDHRDSAISAADGVAQESALLSGIGIAIDDVLHY